MAKIVFLRRTENEIRVFGGDVFIDLDGKRYGTLSTSNIYVDLPEGEHKIKMYKSHTYDTVIGIAEVNVTLRDNDPLMVQYSCPMMISQPGNIVISSYSEKNENQVMNSKESIINKDFNEQELQKRKMNEKHNRAIVIVICIAIIFAIIYAINYSIIMNSF